MLNVLILVLSVNALGSYDAGLCEKSQRMIVNADQDSFDIKVLSGEGNGFHVIQMDAEPSVVTIATTVYAVEIDDESIPVSVGCKMVNRDRVNDVLNLELDGPPNSCRTINERTYAEALRSLSSEALSRYEEEGRKLYFSDDYLSVSGAEWLPSSVHEYIKSSSKGLTVTAPSVQVPWDEEAREFYQGTHHCKLITIAAMQRWMQEYAFTATKALYPIDDGACIEPVSMTSTVGSCRFWFAPAQSRFCQDYTGKGWTQESAKEECSNRHASPEALAAADNRYTGAGGVYDSQSCRNRPDSPGPVASCVFHCGGPDESLWQVLEADSGGPAGAAMMRRACDLYLEL